MTDNWLAIIAIVVVFVAIGLLFRLVVIWISAEFGRKDKDDREGGDEGGDGGGGGGD